MNLSKQTFILTYILTVTKLWNIFTTVVVVLVVLCAVFLMGSRVLGFKVFNVLSGSMEPVYPVGSVICVKPVDALSLAVGDDITFLLNERVVATHRIVEVLPDEADGASVFFRTQGIANNAPDANPVHSKNVLGTPVCCIPWLGWAVNFVQTPPGSYIAAAAAVLMLALAFLPDLFKNKKSK